MTPTIALVGPGKVGCAISARLHAAGLSITTVVSREQSRAQDACCFIGCSENLATTHISSAVQADIILIAVPDDYIAETSQALQDSHSLGPDQTLVHFSGLLPAQILSHTEDTTRENGLLSFHPLMPFADREHGVKQLENCPCALEGNHLGLKVGKLLANKLSVRDFNLRTNDKATYHTAASMASNFAITLLATAKQLLDQCQIDEYDSLTLLNPLVNATLENLFTSTPEEALTGPIVRGDTQTVSQHIDTISKEKPDLLGLYLELATRTLTIATSSGRLQPDKAERLTSLLNGNLNHS